jgi:5-deoxy-glucuronate isomerase
MSWLHRGSTSITPASAGWKYCGMKIMNLDDQNNYEIFFKDFEGVLLSLSAENVKVEVDGVEFKLIGRAGVFAGISDWIYIPVGATVKISGNKGLIALSTAQASKKFPTTYTGKEAVSVEIRGSGFATRQVNNIATPDSFQGAEKILVCEVITPGGNWSSWPPHRHDGIAGCEFNNEEIYYFQIGKQDADHGSPEGRGYFRVYSYDQSIDETLTILDKDFVVVPHGYHGPSIAAPEYPMYFLNVLAGPAENRNMGFCDDPSHHWIRESWKSQQQDPRLPMTTKDGKRVLK